MTDHKPGTIAGITVQSGAVHSPALRSSDGGWRVAPLGDFYYDREVTDVRPLVVLDPEDREQVDRLWIALRDGLALRARDNLQEALRALTKPPKPAEPTGLGAVVEDVKGVRWVRLGELGYKGADDWKYAGTLRTRENDWTTYDHINAVRVLSKGVQA